MDNNRFTWVLLYAKTQETVVPDGKMKLADGNIILFRTLDLNQKFSKIEKCLNALINYKL